MCVSSRCGSSTVSYIALVIELLNCDYWRVTRFTCHSLTNCVTSRRTKTGFNYGVQRNLGKQGDLSQKTVAVSKPCCPACWDLMDVLRGREKDHFLVHSRHSTVYPVELPLWLPKDACQEMVFRFQKHLFKLWLLLNPSQTPRQWTTRRSFATVTLIPWIVSNLNLSLASDVTIQFSRVEV
jgi:hypothetical protein